MWIRTAERHLRSSPSTLTRSRRDWGVLLKPWEEKIRELGVTGHKIHLLGSNLSSHNSMTKNNERYYPTTRSIQRGCIWFMWLKFGILYHCKNVCHDWTVWTLKPSFHVVVFRTESLKISEFQVFHTSNIQLAVTSLKYTSVSSAIIWRYNCEVSCRIHWECVTACWVSYFCNAGGK